MNRRLKTVAVALLALVALTAFVAQVAQATGVGKITAESYPASVSTIQDGNNVFKIGTGIRELECTTADYTGSLTAESAEFVLTPLYEGCTSKPGALPATITTNGCTLTLTATKTPQNLNATILCPAGKQIEVHIYENATKHKEDISLCTYDIAAQSPIAAGTWADEGTGTAQKIRFTLAVEPVVLNTLGPATLCGAAAGANVKATLSGTQTLIAKNSSGGADGLMIG
jgi:hypothetical protein